MIIKGTRFYAEWKPVKGGFKKEQQKCPRCNNIVHYFLACDGGFDLFSILESPYSKRYAYKCPICPNFEPVDDQVAKAIIKGG